MYTIPAMILVLSRVPRVLAVVEVVVLPGVVVVVAVSPVTLTPVNVSKSM